MTRLHAASIGHSVDIVSTGVGVVHSVFARAVNFEVCGNMWTLLSAPQADLPYGIRLPLTSLEALGLRSGDSVYVRAGFIGIGCGEPRLVVDCRTTPRWIAKSPTRLESGLGGRLALVSAAARARSWPGSAVIAHAVVRALQNGAAALDDVLVKVVGRGPGVTPSGDDVLIGILAVLTSPCSGIAGAKAAAAIGRLIDRLLPTTTTVSGHLLRQAVKGLLSRPLQELISALVGNSGPEEFVGAIKRVVDTGATSGADACMGMLACASAFLETRDMREAT
jgi:hypothetical protein